ncbi:hypothetical protein D3C73_1171000 [compost metagenome]
MRHAQRRAHDDGDIQFGRGRHHPRQRFFALVQQGFLMEEIVAGVGRQAQFGKGHQHGTALGGLLGQFDGLRGVEGRIGDAAFGYADRHPGEAVGIQVEERVRHRVIAWGQ